MSECEMVLSAIRCALKKDVIHETETSLSEMMSELTGSLEDIDGIEDFRKMLD